MYKASMTRSFARFQKNLDKKITRMEGFVKGLPVYDEVVEKLIKAAVAQPIRVANILKEFSPHDRAHVISLLPYKLQRSVCQNLTFFNSL